MEIIREMNDKYIDTPHNPTELETIMRTDIFRLVGIIEGIMMFRGE